MKRLINPKIIIRLLMFVFMFYVFSNSMLSELFKKGCKADLNICTKIPAACNTRPNELSDSEQISCVWKSCTIGAPGWCSDGTPTYNEYAATCIINSNPCQSSSRCRVCTTYWASAGRPSNFPEGYACSTNVTNNYQIDGSVGSAGLQGLESISNGPQLIEYTTPNNIGEAIRPPAPSTDLPIWIVCFLGVKCW